MGTEPVRSAARRRTALTAGCALLVLGLLMPSSPDARTIAVADPPGRGQVTFGFDKVEPARLVGRGIPVAQAAGPRTADARTIYSVRVPRLRRGQKLLVRGTVALGRCNESDQRPGGGAHRGARDSPCEAVRHPYAVPSGGHYEPKIAVRAFLGSDRSDLGQGIGSWKVRRCSTALHHCPLSVRTRLTHLQHRSRSMRLNLAVTAFSPKARRGARGRPVDIVELAGNCARRDFNPCKPVQKGASSNTQGELAAIRFGFSGSPAASRTTRKLVNRRIRVQASERVTRHTRPRIIIRQRLDHLSPGDVIDAKASFHLRDGGGDRYVFRHEVSGLLFLSPGPRAPHPGSRGRWLAPTARTNCPHASGCTISKVGAATVPDGAPRTMWVTLVASARDSGGVNGAPLDLTRGKLRAAIDRAGDRAAHGHI
jgi:hypothetical protein